jgi:Flp pilus assembly protein TadB
MTPLGWVGFGIVLFIGVSALVLVTACCMRSSQISRMEEQQKKMHDYWTKRLEEHWVLDKDQQWRLVTKPEEGKQRGSGQVKAENAEVRELIEGKRDES